jgi:hypothetical protein
VVVKKYEIQRGGWCLEETRAPYGVGLWRNIRNDWGYLSNFISGRMFGAEKRLSSPYS